MKTDVLVIGGGLSGLNAALSALRKGAETTVLAAGMGVLPLSSGCIDLMAYPNGPSDKPVSNPLDAIGELKEKMPDHPYCRMDEGILMEAIHRFLDTCIRQGFPFKGDGNGNFLVPTAMGTAKPTAWVPMTMAAGDLRDKKSITLIGLKGFRDFSVDLVKSGIQDQFGIDVNSAEFDASQALEGELIRTMGLSRAFEQSSFRVALVAFAKGIEDLGDRIGIPAVLGVDYANKVHQFLEEAIGKPIFEIPILPPSLPGTRIFKALKREIFELGGQLITGVQVLSAEKENSQVTSVKYKAGVNEKFIQAKSVVLATGGFFSGGVVASRKDVKEPVFGLPIGHKPAIDQRYKKDFLDRDGHPLGRSGILFDDDLRPCDEKRDPVFDNLFACGDILAGFDSLYQRCGGGVSISTGYVAGKKAAEAASK